MKWLLAFFALLSALPAQAAAPVLIIAHRGASGERPEHTLAGYERAIDKGADFIEPDLVVTRDGVLVARHENEISGTTDVGSHPEFASRKTTKTIDGQQVQGWFVEDFTLAELRTLRARERLPQLRPANARFDGLYPIPTFAEILALVRAKEAETGRRVGIYPELKHPTFLAGLGFDTASTLLAQLAAAGYSAKRDPIFIQCFEVATLESLRKRTALRLVQLVSADGGPADRPSVTYADMTTAKGMADVAAYADAIGAEASLVLDDAGRPTPFAAMVHKAGLDLHVWTLRKENAFLPARLRIGADLAARGCYERLFDQMARAGVDGVFTDDPALAIAARASASGSHKRAIPICR